jgi:hypothetical protein
MPIKRVFYEQVTDVNVFSFSRVFAFSVVVAPHVALHRVSIRTLDELT